METTNQTQTQDPDQNQKDIEQNKAIAFLSYLSILFLIPLLAKPESKFCIHHAKNGLVLFIAGLIVGLIMIVPFIGWVIGFLGGIVLLVYAIVGIVKSLRGEYWTMPFLGQYTDKFNL